MDVERVGHLVAVAVTRGRVGGQRLVDQTEVDRHVLVVIEAGGGQLQVVGQLGLDPGLILVGVAQTAEQVGSLEAGNRPEDDRRLDEREPRRARVDAGRRLQVDAVGQMVERRNPRIDRAVASGLGSLVAVVVEADAGIDDEVAHLPLGLGPRADGDAVVGIGGEDVVVGGQLQPEVLVEGVAAHRQLEAVAGVAELDVRPQRLQRGVLRHPLVVRRRAEELVHRLGAADQPTFVADRLAVADVHGVEPQRQHVLDTGVGIGVAGRVGGAQRRDRDLAAVGQPVAESGLVVPVAKDGVGRQSLDDVAEGAVARRGHPLAVLAQLLRAKQAGLDDRQVGHRHRVVADASGGRSDAAAGEAAFVRRVAAGLKGHLVDEARVYDRRPEQQVVEHRHANTIDVVQRVPGQGPAQDRIAQARDRRRRAGQQRGHADRVAHGAGHRADLVVGQ